MNRPGHYFMTTNEVKRNGFYATFECLIGMKHSLQTYNLKTQYGTKPNFAKTITGQVNFFWR